MIRAVKQSVLARGGSLTDLLSEIEAMTRDDVIQTLQAYEQQPRSAGVVG